LFLPGLTSEGRGHAGVTGGIVPGTGKNIVVSVSIWRDALLEGEIAEARRAWEVAEERFFRMMNSSSEGVQRLVAYKVGHHEQFTDLSLLWIWGIELCLAILALLPGRTPLPKRMWTAILHHVRVTRELAALWAAMSSSTERVLGHLTGETFGMKVMSELAG
jgi:hypothetical protein